MTWPENPHCGNSGVPFMNSTTGFSEITFSIRSRAFDMAQSPHPGGGQGPAVFTPPDIARRGVRRQREPDKKAGRDQPPVVFMWRSVAGAEERAMTKSWPLGLWAIAARIAA